MRNLIIKDEALNGDILQEIQVTIEKEKITVKDIIAARVISDVVAYNNKFPEYYKGLIKPTEAEETLNGYKLKPHKKVDSEQQVYIALEAFQKNQFFILVDNQQCEDLNQELFVNKNTTISFIKLTPLVGG